MENNQRRHFSLNVSISTSYDDKLRFTGHGLAASGVTSDGQKFHHELPCKDFAEAQRLLLELERLLLNRTGDAPALPEAEERNEP